MRECTYTFVDEFTATAEDEGLTPGDTMAGQKVPRIWYVADEYPRTGSGKIQKVALVEQIERGLLRPVS